MPDHGMDGDPLGLDEVDRRIRANEREERLRETGSVSPFLDDSMLDDDDAVLPGGVDFENGPRAPYFSRLEEAGVALPEPEAIDDAALPGKLREIFDALARMDIFVSSTDHLCDRDLYIDLWCSVLRTEATITPPGSGWRNYLDLIGGCSEEDIQIWLRYYADDEDRADWARQWGNEEVPPKEPRPYDRDRSLPKPPIDTPNEDETSDEPFDADWP